MRCKYCYVGENKALNNGLMPESVAKAAVDFCLKRSGDLNSISLTFFGGEPLLNKPVLRSVIAYSQAMRRTHRKKKVHYVMTTNGTLIDDEIIGYIKRHNFGLMISMDGPKDVHDAVRPLANGRGSFELAAANVKRLMERRKQVTVRCTISNAYLDKTRLVEFFEDFGFTRIGIARCNGKSYELGPYDCGPKENEILDQHDRYLLERYFEQLENGKETPYNPADPVVRDIHQRTTHRGVRCGVGRGCATVGIDGRIYPCHRYVGMEKYVLGDIWKGINKEVYADYLREYFRIKKKCELCWAINICGGVCPWYVAHPDGTCHEPPGWVCDNIKKWFEEGAYLYVRLAADHPEHFARLVGLDLKEKAKPEEDFPARPDGSVFFREEGQFLEAESREAEPPSAELDKVSGA